MLDEASAAIPVVTHGEGCCYRPVQTGGARAAARRCSRHLWTVNAVDLEVAAARANKRPRCRRWSLNRPASARAVGWPRQWTTRAHLRGVCRCVALCGCLLRVVRCQYASARTSACAATPACASHPPPAIHGLTIPRFRTVSGAARSTARAPNHQRIDCVEQNPHPVFSAAGPHTRRPRTGTAGRACSEGPGSINADAVDRDSAPRETRYGDLWPPGSRPPPLPPGG
jgi:hypothetical protein